MTTKSDFYLFTLNKDEKFLLDPEGLNTNSKLKYGHLILWTFNHEKFQMNFILKKKDEMILFSFGRCEQLRSLLIERGVASKSYDILTIEKTKGFTKSIILKLDNGIQTVIRGGYGFVLSSTIEKNKTITIDGYDDVFNDDPFKRYRNEPKLIASELLENEDAEPAILKQWKSLKNNESKNSFFGCSMAILLYGGGTILLFLLILWILAKFF